jgi:hypothetical protein
MKPRPSLPGVKRDARGKNGRSRSKEVKDKEKEEVVVV